MGIVTRYAPRVGLSGVACIPAMQCDISTSGGPYYLGSRTPRFGPFNHSTKPERLSFQRTHSTFSMFKLARSRPIWSAVNAVKVCFHATVLPLKGGEVAGKWWGVGETSQCDEGEAERMFSEISTNTICLVLLKTFPLRSSVLQNQRRNLSIHEYLSANLLKSVRAPRAVNRIHRFHIQTLTR